MKTKLTFNVKEISLKVDDIDKDHVSPLKEVFTNINEEIQSIPGIGNVQSNLEDVINSIDGYSSAKITIKEMQIEII